MFFKSQSYKLSIKIILGISIFFIICCGRQEITSDNQKTIDNNQEQQSQDNTLQIKLTTENDYSLTGPLQDVIVDITNCGVTTSVTNVSLASNAARIVWHDTCSFSFISIKYNNVTYNAIGSNMLNSASTFPLRVNFENDYALQIVSSTDLYNTNAQSGTPTLNISLVNNSLAILSAFAKATLDTKVECTYAGKSLTCRKKNYSP